MFCPKCGNQIPDGAAFCSQCGNQLADRMAQQTPQVPQGAPQPQGYAAGTPQPPQGYAGTPQPPQGYAGAAPAAQRPAYQAPATRIPGKVAPLYYVSMGLAALAVIFTFIPWLDVNGYASGSINAFGAFSSAMGGRGYGMADSYNILSLSSLATGLGEDGTPFMLMCTLPWILAVIVIIAGIIVAFVGAKKSTRLIGIGCIVLVLVSAWVFFLLFALSEETYGILMVNAWPGITILLAIVATVLCFVNKPVLR